MGGNVTDFPLLIDIFLLLFLILFLTQFRYGAGEIGKQVPSKSKGTKETVGGAGRKGQSGAEAEGEKGERG